MKKFMFFLSIITLLFIGCDDMEPSTDHLDCLNPIYPNMTTSGVNKLACKVNGKIWVSCTPAFALFDPPFRMGYDSVNGHFGINSWWITRDKSIDENVGFQSNIGIGSLGVYAHKYSFVGSNYVTFNSGYTPFWVDTSLVNTIEILFHDKIRRIISGKFEFTAISASRSDTVRITEGIFDGKY